MQQEAAYLVLIDGLPIAFTTTEQISNEYVQGLGFESRFPGLEFPSGLSTSIEVRTGQLDGTSGTLKIRDVYGTLPQIFGYSEDQEPLLFNVPAGSAPLEAEALWGKHIGTEKIGPAGERRQHSCVPGYNVGLEHISEQQAYANGATASPISDTPVLIDGRRFCLYRLVRNSDGSWPDLTDPDEQAAARLYFGTLTGQGDPDDRVWSLSVAGPESWIMRSLGTGYSNLPLQIDAKVTLNEDARDHWMVGWLSVTSILDEIDETLVYAAQTTNTTYLSGASSYAEIAAAVGQFLDDLANDASLDGPLTSHGQSNLRYSTTDGADGLILQWDRDSTGVGGTRYGLRLQLLLSPLVTRVLGYSPAEQASVAPTDYDRYLEFRPNTVSNDVPDHIRFVCWTASPSGMQARADGAAGVTAQDSSSGGAERVWGPLFRGGCSLFDVANGQNQTFRAIISDPLFMPSSKAVPLPADPNDQASPLSIEDVGEVEKQGIVVFSGMFRDETVVDFEPKEIALPARVAWREAADGRVATDGEWPTFAIVEWIEPALLGFPPMLLPSSWATWRLAPPDAKPTTMRPLLVLEHGREPDNVALLLARMFTSTGSAGQWFADEGLTTPLYGLNSPGYLAVGNNDLEFGDGSPTDAEVPLYGLGVPASMIATGSDRGSFELAIEEMAQSDLGRCKVALGKVADSRTVIASMLSPTGYAISLAGGKFGLFDPYRMDSPVEDQGILDVENIAGKAGELRESIPKQRFRVWAPIDELDLSARMQPITGDFARKETIRSPDPGKIYRAQTLKQPIDGSHLVHEQYVGEGSNWDSALRDRIRVVTKFWGRSLFEVTQTVPLRRHAEFWPGAIATLSNEWLVNPSRQIYGVTEAPGFVLGRTVNPDRATMDVRAIVDGSNIRVYAPAARAVRYDRNVDGEGHRLLVLDDYLGIRAGTGTKDAFGFQCPEWCSAGGDADIEAFSFDGTTWRRGIYGQVASITEIEGGGCWINLTGAMTGERWFRDRHHIIVIRNALEQTAAWPFEVFSPIGNKLGKWEGNNFSPPFKD